MVYYLNRKQKTLDKNISFILFTKHKQYIRAKKEQTKKTETEVCFPFNLLKNSPLFRIWPLINVSHSLKRMHWNWTELQKKRKENIMNTVRAKRAHEQEATMNRLKIHGRCLWQKDAKMLYLNKRAKSYSQLNIFEWFLDHFVLCYIHRTIVVFPNITNWLFCDQSIL